MIAAVLLLLLVLYAGSYLALVIPQGFNRLPNSLNNPTNMMALINYPIDHYRWGGMGAAQFFYPLERIDRTVRPQAWKD
jgi:hypothetical protein